jgi:nicotinamide mononucleotide transporter
MNDSLSFAGFSTTPLELVSFALSVVMVLMNIRQNHWGWFLGIVSSATYGIVFFNARLYGDASLQVVFILSGIWGWSQWLRGAGESRLVVTRLSPNGWTMSLAAWGIGYLLLAWFLHAYTNTDVPHADGFLTAGSLLGTVLLARKKVENWHVWIAVDVLYVGLYIYKGLMLTAILYGIFVALAVGGLRAWANVAAAEAR